MNEKLGPKRIGASEKPEADRQTPEHNDAKTQGSQGKAAGTPEFMRKCIHLEIDGIRAMTIRDLILILAVSTAVAMWAACRVAGWADERQEG